MLRAFGIEAALALALALGFATGCGTFDVRTSPGFVELQNQTEHAYRATTTEGIVMAVRVVDDERRGDLVFWSDAVTRQLRDVTGYSLLSANDVLSADGTKGRRLDFGHDEDGKPYVYSISIFPSRGRLFLVEAGGAKDAFERARPNIDWMTKSVRLECRFIPLISSSKRSVRCL
jgi:hypothetical protein